MMRSPIIHCPPMYTLKALYHLLNNSLGDVGKLISSMTKKEYLQRNVQKTFCEDTVCQFDDNDVDKSVSADTQWMVDEVNYGRRASTGKTISDDDKLKNQEWQ